MFSDVLKKIQDYRIIMIYEQSLQFIF
jgi:hypothetical protein